MANNGTIYLIHFERPYKHARHYLGWAIDLEHRLRQHRAGHGARLLDVIQRAGIAWSLARTWSGTRTRERQLKRQGGASRCCPLCGVRPPRKFRIWESRELTRIARRLFTLVDADEITTPPVLAYARTRLAIRLTNPAQAITPADLLGWTERTTTMTTLTYTTPYIRADGSVWCVQEDAETGTEHTCRMVIDIETGLSLFLPDYLIDVDAEHPTSRNTGDIWPLFRWATRTDLEKR